MATTRRPAPADQSPARPRTVPAAVRLSLPGGLGQLVADRIDALHAGADAARHRPRRARSWWRRSFDRPTGPVAEPAFLGGRPPRSGGAELVRWTDLLAAHVAEHGIATAERAVHAVVRTARRRGATTPALLVLADPGEPAVVRERALGIVLGELRRSRDDVATRDSSAA